MFLDPRSGSPCSYGGALTLRGKSRLLSLRAGASASAGPVPAPRCRPPGSAGRALAPRRCGRAGPSPRRCGAACRPRLEPPLTVSAAPPPPPAGRGGRGLLATRRLPGRGHGGGGGGGRLFGGCLAEPPRLPQPPGLLRRRQHRQGGPGPPKGRVPNPGAVVCGPPGSRTVWGPRKTPRRGGPLLTWRGVVALPIEAL